MNDTKEFKAIFLVPHLIATASIRDACPDLVARMFACDAPNNGSIRLEAWIDRYGINGKKLMYPRDQELSPKGRNLILRGAGY